MKTWTEKTLTSEMMAVLRKRSTSITMGDTNSKKEVANSSWPKDGSWVEITIDPFQCGILQGVIHELLHFVLRGSHHYKMDYWIEEAQIQALEDELVSRIRKHPSMFRSWKLAINRKLGRKS